MGRAHLGLALASTAEAGSNSRQRDHAIRSRIRLDKAVDGLRASGEFGVIARGLLVRVAFRRGVGDWDGAARDLDEVEEIAEPGPMKLHLCDMALERARLALARIAAFAPLNGVVHEDPPKPVLPGFCRGGTLEG